MMADMVVSEGLLEKFDGEGWRVKVGRLCLGSQREREGRGGAAFSAGCHHPSEPGNQHVHAAAIDIQLSLLVVDCLLAVL